MATRPFRSGIAWRRSLSAFVLLNSLDVVTTWIALSLGMREANPIPSMVLAAGGPAALLLFKAGVVLGVVAMMGALTPAYPSLWRGLTFANVVLGVIVLSNGIQLLLPA